MNELYKNIVNLIASNEAEKAISLLIEKIEGKHDLQSVYHEAVIINSRIIENNKSRRINTISNEEFNIVKSQIINSFLETIKPLNSLNEIKTFKVELLSEKFERCPKCRRKFEYILIADRPNLKMVECANCQYMISFKISTETNKWQMASNLIGVTGGIAGFLALLGVSANFDLEDFLDEIF